jgi:hypothetical protein
VGLFGHRSRPSRRVAAAIAPPVVGDQPVAVERRLAEERSHTLGDEPGVHQDDRFRVSRLAHGQRRAIDRDPFGRFDLT